MPLNNKETNNRYLCIYGVRGLWSFDKTVVNVILLEEINFKIKTEEGNSSNKPLPTCGYPLIEKGREKLP